MTPEDVTAHPNADLREENARLKLQLDDLRKALDHATTCPLIQKARDIMGDNPEKITACLGCRDALLLLGQTKKPVKESPPSQPTKRDDKAPPNWMRSGRHG